MRSLRIGLLMTSFLVTSVFVYALTKVTMLATNNEQQNYAEAIKAKVDSLLLIMTLEEKVGQMGSIGLTAICDGPFWNGADSLILDEAKMHDMLINNHIGTLLSKGKYPPSKEEWYSIVKQVQSYLDNNQRVKIPAFMANDAVHGSTYTANSTVFPHQIGLAATWDPQFAEQAASITSYEFRASNNTFNYAPDVDVAPQPQWGRGFETFGEDSYLTVQMANAFIKGAQGDNMADTSKTVVCLKHFLGYGNPAIGKDRANAYMAENELRQIYMPPFVEGIKNGAMSVMVNSSCINGVPVLTSKYWLTDVLKSEIGFKGVVVSDWDDLNKMVTIHRVAKDSKEAAAIAVNAGMDMCMIPYDAQFCKDVIALVKEGKILEDRVNDAAGRVLTLKLLSGIFEHSVVNPANYTKFASEESANASLTMALEGITLLKNEGVLPIKLKDKKFLVTGPGANSTTALNGPWTRSWAGTDTTYEDDSKLTIYEAMMAQYGNKNVVYASGCTYTKEISYADAVAKAKGVDYIIASLGEEPSTEKPSDIDLLDLDVAQVELIKRLATTGKPIIVVLQQNRPRIIREIEPLVDAIFLAYWSSHEGGVALAKLINGEVSPSGKLPFTYHKYSGNVVTYNSKPCDRFSSSGQLDNYKPQYHFGYGMSYSTFSYSNVTVNRDSFAYNDIVTIGVDVTNTGTMKAKEVVQLYFADLVASISPNMSNLIRFTKIELLPNETKRVQFSLTAKDLMFVNLQNRWVIEEGDFELMIGPSSNNTYNKKIYYKENK